MTQFSSANAVTKLQELPQREILRFSTEIAVYLGNGMRPMVTIDH